MRMIAKTGIPGDFQTQIVARGRLRFAAGGGTASLARKRPFTGIIGSTEPAVQLNLPEGT